MVSSGFMYGMFGLGALIVAMAVILIVALAVVFYVFFSLSLYRIAKRRGIDTPGLAWVPIVQMWTVGCLAMDYDRRTNQKSMRYDHLLLWFSVATFVISAITAVVLAVIAATNMFNGFSNGTIEIASGQFNNWFVMAPAITTSVLFGISLLKIYQSCSKKNYTVLFILSLVFPFIVPFTLFALKNSDEGLPGDPETAENPQHPRPPVTAETPEPMPQKPKIDMAEYDPYPEDAITCEPEEQPDKAEIQEVFVVEAPEPDAGQKDQAEGDACEKPKKEDVYEEY